MKDPDLVSVDFLINLVGISHDRQLVCSSVAGFGRHEWKIRVPSNPTLDQIHDRVRAVALIEIGKYAVR